MDNAKSTPEISVFFSRKDENFHTEFEPHLKSIGLRSKESVDWWSDARLTSSSWSEELSATLDSCRVVLLLVSKNFLVSDFIGGLVLPQKLDKLDRGNELKIFWILLSPCQWNLTIINNYSLLNSIDKPVAALRPHAQELIWHLIVKQVKLEFEKVPFHENEGTSANKTTVKSVLQQIDKSSETFYNVTENIESQKQKFFFVSHSEKDGDFVDILQKKLEEKYLETWIDTDYLQPGERWREKIDNAITNCLAVILVVSPKAMSSSYITYEWAYALGREKQVIPIMLDSTELHLRLAEYQYHDFTNRKSRPWQKLFDQLQEFLE